jgi:dephospho-CoA kinase
MSCSDREAGSEPPERTERPPPLTLRVGLTGGIASGKSTVGRLMAERGCTVVDADRLVKDLYRPGEPGARAVERLFGPQLLDPLGAVDAGALAARVFRDSEARRELETAIHPLVAGRFEELAARDGGIVVFEATLLVETGGYQRFDVLVTVEADPELRIERAVARGLDEASARARLSAQASTEERVAVADLVIRNDGTEAELASRVDQLVAELERRRRDR